MTPHQLQKVEMRRLARALRKEALLATPNCGALFMHQFVKVDMPAQAIIAGYRALPDEVDIEPVLTLFHVNGHPLAMPVVEEKSRPLLFRSYKPGDVMRRGMKGVEEPLSIAAAVTPDVLLVPLTAFDRRGARLGQGGGYYDRTLAGLRCTKTIMAIGVALSVQEMPNIPLEKHDALLDYIVTEKEVIRCSLF
ncbi:MAG: 5-formyltetrahydrofolate cyclo-ligase [Alphaproteobacteria bacterium]|nr:5-formyltetrahydrofolate cyclo-ligase [Alphaproteobacteria bacterium]MBV8548866.1 5-formyltetrahydrofolate cyclo-ligase [Alphaproteobacteria bacterium]